jgi:hypothetical protein
VTSTYLDTSIILARYLPSDPNFHRVDALHLAYASTMKELVPDLGSFTTLDKDISSRSEAIQNRSGISIVTPRDM